MTLGINKETLKKLNGLETGKILGAGATFCECCNSQDIGVIVCCTKCPKCMQSAVCDSKEVCK